MSNQTREIDANREQLQLGKIIPLVILLAFIADLLFRPISIQGDKERYRLSNSPFEPSIKIQVKTIGDIARLANLPKLGHHREFSFTTDAWGYRNIPVKGDLASPSAIFTGDSFGFIGSDGETLPEQLSKISKHKIYNASTTERVASNVYPPTFRYNPQRIIEIARREGMRKGIVIFEIVERLDSPTIEAATQISTVDSFRKDFCDAVLSCGQGNTLARMRGLMFTSPLQSIAEDALARLQNNKFLPNSRAARAMIGVLVNQERMLFLHQDDGESSELPRKRNMDEHVFDYYKFLAQELKPAGLSLFVVLVPNKYTVYQPLLLNPSLFTEQKVSYLHWLEQGLKNRGIACINLTSTLQLAASRAIQNGSYLYWVDDTHWNREGVRTAAEELGKHLKWNE